MGLPKLVIFITNILILSIFTGSCKYSPNQMRSTLKSKNVYNFIAKGSIKFTRSSAQTTGDLTFLLTSPYSCAVEYWAEDLNEPPSASAPKYIQCPDGKMDQKIFISGLDASVPYTFKILVWPESLTAASGAYIILKETLNLKEQETSHIVFHQFNSPRQIGETYTFQRSSAQSLFDLRNELIARYPIENGVVCQNNPIVPQNPYTRNLSEEDSKKRPLHGLVSLSTDGYAFGGTRNHPFFNTRLIHQFENVERLKNWTWQFQWEDLAYEFTTFPPGYIEDLNLSSGDQSHLIKNRELLGVLPSYQVGVKTLEFNIDVIFPGQINFVHIELKDPFDKNRALYCSYLYENSKFTLPDEFYKLLEPGTYDMTVSYESIQIHYKSNLPYPPWVISSQDWIHAKLKKVL